MFASVHSSLKVLNFKCWLKHYCHCIIGNKSHFTSSTPEMNESILRTLGWTHASVSFVQINFQYIDPAKLFIVYCYYRVMISYSICYNSHILLISANLLKLYYCYIYCSYAYCLYNTCYYSVCFKYPIIIIILSMIYCYCSIIVNMLLL